MTITQKLFIFILIILSSLESQGQSKPMPVVSNQFKIYPQINDIRPDLPSPFVNNAGEEFVIAVTKDSKYAIIPVTLRNDRKICKQLIVDTLDFLYLVKTGLHYEQELVQVETITGRHIDKITEFGRPGGLSHSGFMAEDEDIISVITADNRIVAKLGFTHPQLAKPLFHILNMMEADMELNRWNMAKHRWENITCFYYNNQKVFVDVSDTKGGQKSIFNDNIEGAFHIRIWRELDDRENHFLNEHYGHLSPERMEESKKHLSFINTGEMQPQYIMRYGFYEGHTFWRADPIAISFIFGFKSLEELDIIFEGKLFKTLSGHFTE